METENQNGPAPSDRGQPPVPTAPAAVKPASSDPNDQKRHLRHHLWTGIIILIASLAFDCVLNKTEPGHDLQLLTYRWLHQRMASPSLEDDVLPVVLYDISDLGQERHRGKKYTSRQELETLVRTLAIAKPAAIGVDIDLSPEDDGFFAPGTREFFDSCLELQQQHIPVFLGVRRKAPKGTDQWLINAKYASLAAGISCPTGAVTEMTSEIETIDRESHQTNRLPSLCRRLSEAFSEDKKIKSPSLAWPLSLVTEKASHHATSYDDSSESETRFLVDYSPYHRFHELKGTSTNEWKNLIRGKAVLLGGIEETSDKVNVPVESVPVPGVFVHACAAYTLLYAPLFELKGWAGLGLSFLISFGALELILLARKRYSAHHTAAVPLTMVLSVLCMVAIFLVARELATLWRIVWVEAWVAILVVAGHCAAEIFLASVGWTHIRKAVIKLSEAFSSFVRGLIFADEH